MPRNKSLLKGAGSNALSARSRGTGGPSTSGARKIVIKPYSKPPTLPADYYDHTVAELLQGTLGVLQQQQQQQQTASSTSSINASSHLRPPPNVQYLFDAVVNLVKHHYGPRLYSDLQRSMTQAAVMVLPSPAAALNTASSSSLTGAAATSTKPTTICSSSPHPGHLLQYIPTQYQLYYDYLTLVRHIFLELDQNYVWSWSTQTAVKASGGGGGSSHAAAALASAKVYSIWQTGVQQFGARLKELGLDEQLYQEWLRAFLNDWNRSSSHGGSGVAGSGGAGVISATTSRADLQAVWYLWQDVGLLPTLPLQQDLETFWKARSQEWMDSNDSGTDNGVGGGYYRAAAFLQYAHDKHVHAVTAWQPWLPSSWLCSILEQCVLQPHLTNEYLLKPQHFYPILQAELSTSHAGTTTAAVAAAAAANSITIGAGGTSAAIVAAGTHAAIPLTPIQQLWMLSSRVPNGQQQVAAALCQFCKQEGLQLVTRKSTPPTQMIADLLHFQDSLNALIARLPHGSEFINLKNTWEEVVNVDAAEPSIAECLAKFLDQLLRSNKKMDQYQNAARSSTGSDGAGDAQWLQRILNGLFVPIQAKDTFEGFYKNYLAKRLLWNRVVSMDVEKQVCSLLKTECGAGYTSKMEGMFQDIDWSRETMMVYKQSSAGQPLTTKEAVEMEVQVLTTGYWPVYKNWEGLHLPDTLLVPQERFANHYKTKYQGRRMAWQYSLGHCVVRTNGFSKTYDLVVSLCQALVLTQFVDDETRLTLPVLMNLIGLEDRDEMERLLQSLALGKDGTRILRKIDHDATPGSVKKPRMTVDDRDLFCINTSFESNQRRIRIQNIMMKETKEEREKTTEAVSRDRLYLIDAVLVRIMKARKTILHQVLIAQVMEQVKVPAQAADIKKRIESLIEREYMERDAKDRNRYNYLA